MVNQYKCLSCGHSEVCKIMDIIAKFDAEAKKPLGVDITMDQCSNFETNGEDE